jgi:hypothetical protein
VTETGHGPSFCPPGPDYQLESLRLAVALYTGQGADEGTVLHTAAEFHDRLTRDRDITPGTAREILTRLDFITTRMETIMAALDSLQAADTALKAEVTTAITDWAAQLAAANSANDPAIQAVADDMNAQVSALQAADTGTATPPAAPSGTSN